MLARTAWFLAALSVVPTAAHSQQNNIPDICGSALADGIRDGYEVYSSRERVSIFVKRVRQIHAETLNEFREQAESIGLDVPLAEGTIGLSGSDSARASMFKSTFDSFKLNQHVEERTFDFLNEKIATVNTSLVQSWSRCADRYLEAFMKLNAKGIFLDAIPFDNASAFTARISVRSDRRGKIRIISISPDQTACVSNFGQAIMAGTTFDTATFFMTCRKDPDSWIPFAVTTDEGATNTVNVPARTSRLTELEAHLGALEARIGRIDEKLTALTASFSPFSSLNPTSLGALAQQITVPSGTMVNVEGSLRVGDLVSAKGISPRAQKAIIGTTPNNWNNWGIVPNSWTRANAVAWVQTVVPSSTYALACVFENSFSIGGVVAIGNSAPPAPADNACGW